MNLGLILRVLGRFRFLILSGLLFASAAALLSHMRISFDGVSPRLEHRTIEQWQSSGSVLLTQPGFPWGRSTQYGDANSLAELVRLYGALAEGDAVQGIMARTGRVAGSYSATEVASDTGGTLPVLKFVGFSDTPARAQATARRAIEAFRVYLKGLQDEKDVPAARQLEIQVIDSPHGATLIAGRRMTRPIFLFILVMTATIVFAFALENLRPRLRAAPAPSLSSVEAPKLVSEAPRSRG